MTNQTIIESSFPINELAGSWFLKLFKISKMLHLSFILSLHAFLSTSLFQLVYFLCHDADILLGGLLQLHLLISRLQLLIQRRKYGQNFHQKDQSTLLPISLVSSNGRTTALWFLGMDIVHMSFTVDCPPFWEHVSLNCFTLGCLHFGTHLIWCIISITI